MKKVLGLSLFAALVIALGLAKNGLAQSTAAPYHTTVSVSATTAPVPIPPSVACRITNPGTGYTGSVAVKFEASNTSVPIVLNLNLDSGAAPLTAFTPSAGASGYIIFPGAQGTLQFIGTGGSSSTTLTLDCNTLAPSIAQILPLPLAVAKGGTGVASPNPTVTAGACNSLPSLSGWPSFTLTVPAGCSGAGFPLSARQRFCYNVASSSPIACTLDATATSGDLLVAFIGYSCFSGGTITTPSGWSTTFTAASGCAASGEAVMSFNKVSNGTEPGISVVDSNGTATMFLLEISGSHAIDKTATATGTTSMLLAPSLSSPTSTAAVAVLCSSNSGTGGSASGELPTLNTGDPSTPWVISRIGVSNVNSALGLWTGNVGSHVLFYPTFYYFTSSSNACATISIL